MNKNTISETQSTSGSMYSTDLARSSNSLDQVISPDDQRDVIKVTKRRWFVLVAMMVFGLTYSIASTTSPVLHIMLRLLEVDIDTYIYIGLIFDLTMFVLTVPIAWFVDEYGIKNAIRLAAILFLGLGALRALLFYPELAPAYNDTLVLYIAANIVMSVLGAIFWSLPLKISEVWFSSSERSVVWTLMQSQVSVGIGLTSIFLPRCIKDVPDLKLLSYVNVICATASALFTVAFITRSKPKYRANERGARVDEIGHQNIWVSLKRIASQTDLTLHLVHNSLMTSAICSTLDVMQDIYMSTGRSEIFYGDVSALRHLTWLVMLIALSKFVHRMKDTTLVCKSSSLVYAVLFCTEIIGLLYLPNWSMVVITVLVCVSGSWHSPNSVDMTAQLSNQVVPQATVVGLQTSFQLGFTLALKQIFVKLITIDKDHPNSRHHHVDYQKALFFIASTLLVNEIIYIIFFRGHATSRQENERRIESS